MGRVNVETPGVLLSQDTLLYFTNYESRNKETKAGPQRNFVDKCFTLFSLIMEKVAFVTSYAEFDSASYAKLENQF